MNSTPILLSKHAAVFGASGSIGAAVAREFAAEGAEVFLSGRTGAAVEAVAKQIIANGGGRTQQHSTRPMMSPSIDTSTAS